MASVVDKSCGGTSSQMPALGIQENGSRNKRKFRADPSLDLNTAVPSPLNERTDFEFSAEKFEMIRSLGNTDKCDVCSGNQDHSSSLRLGLGLSCYEGTPEVEQIQDTDAIHESSDKFHDADWSDLTESQLEELVLSNLDAIFKSAIKQIIASGYTEELARKAILRSGLWYGCKDILSNIVDNALAFLRNGLDIEPSKEYYFPDLKQIERYILAELVCLLREVRPFFSIGDAMWCLLICDMNVSHACMMDIDPLSCVLGDVDSHGNSFVSAQAKLRTDHRSYGSKHMIPCKKSLSASYARKCLPELPTLPSIKDRHSLQSKEPNGATNTIFNPKASVCFKVPFADDGHQNSLSVSSDKPFGASAISSTTLIDEKFVASRKVCGITKRENMSQKSSHFDRHYRAYGSKGTSRAGKFGSLNGLALDKKLKAMADSTGLNTKDASFQISKVIEFGGPQDTMSSNPSSDSELVSVPTLSSESFSSGLSSSRASISSSLPAVSITSSSVPVADTELSLSFYGQSISNPKSISHNTLGSNSNSVGQWIPLDRKDEMIMKLTPKVQQLQNQLQGWTEWANKKVMQAARRLSEDKADLKILRQEKEEVERLKKEKQILEENTLKKLSEMENSWRKASGQVERANATVHKLEFENAALRQEMESAKLCAAESAASCEEMSNREKKNLLKFRAWEKQKIILQEELSVEKGKWNLMQQKLQHAKAMQDQIKAKLDREEKAKDEALELASNLRKEREQSEAATRYEEDAIKLKVEGNIQKHKYDIERLEKEISQLRLKNDSSKIAALRRGIDGSYSCKLTDIRKSPALQDPKMSYLSGPVTSAVLHNLNGNGGVKRERECVMCLSEEISVVFLPCAHQVVCSKCNELHEKQCMKDCPSCRSPIQHRVCVRYA